MSRRRMSPQFIRVKKVDRREEEWLLSPRDSWVMLRKEVDSREDYTPVNKPHAIACIITNIPPPLPG